MLLGQVSGTLDRTRDALRLRRRALAQSAPSARHGAARAAGGGGGEETPDSPERCDEMSMSAKIASKLARAASTGKLEQAGMATPIVDLTPRSPDHVMTM